MRVAEQRRMQGRISPADPRGCSATGGGAPGLPTSRAPAKCCLPQRLAAPWIGTTERLEAPIWVLAVGTSVVRVVCHPSQEWTAPVCRMGPPVSGRRRSPARRAAPGWGRAGTRASWRVCASTRRHKCGPALRRPRGSPTLLQPAPMRPTQYVVVHGAMSERRNAACGIHRHCPDPD